MIKKNLFRKSLTFVTIILLLGTSTVPSINGSDQETNSENNNLDYKTASLFTEESVLDLEFIYSITENLSNIVFTEYNESAGEIAKGREFGTKGEHKAAEILLENMTDLGLWAYTEKIGEAKPWRPINLLASKIDILEYELKIYNETSSMIVDCAPIFSNMGTNLRPFKRTQNFSFKGLKLRTDHPDTLFVKEDYVLFGGRDNYTDIDASPKTFIDNHIVLSFLRNVMNRYRYRHCKGVISYDFNDDEHNMWRSQSAIPKFAINGTIGKMINETGVENFTVDFYLKQRYIPKVDSWNVIGQLNGTEDPSKTVLVCCLYDSWWCQGTADSAIGMAMVLGIAKYFMENKIEPRYTMKFIGFCGEEYGMRGSQYYEATHRKEDIIYVINLNQLGFKQDIPRLTLNVTANDQKFLDDVWEVVQRSDYVNRTGNVTDIKPEYDRDGHQSDDHSFASKRKPSECKTVCFLKNGNWIMHHRDGLNHTKGDVMSYFNWTDVNITSEIILNVTRYIVEERPLTETQKDVPGENYIETKVEE